MTKEKNRTEILNAELKLFNTSWCKVSGWKEMKSGEPVAKSCQWEAACAHHLHQSPAYHDPLNEPVNKHI